MNHLGPLKSAEIQCERILRSLPEWFGDESSLLEYAQDSKKFETFGTVSQDELIAFLTVRKHFNESYEVHCIAVHANWRNKGVGGALHAHVEKRLASLGATYMQVKTLSSSHPSARYAETRRFYEHVGYAPLEEFPLLWASHLPVLQLVKHVSRVG